MTDFLFIAGGVAVGTFLALAAMTVISAVLTRAEQQRAVMEHASRVAEIQAANLKAAAEVQRQPQPDPTVN